MRQMTSIAITFCLNNQIDGAIIETPTQISQREKIRTLKPSIASGITISKPNIAFRHQLNLTPCKKAQSKISQGGNSTIFNIL